MQKLVLQRLAGAVTRRRTGKLLCAAIRETYRAALIDEFQDTAPMQGHAASNVLSIDAMGGDQGPATVVAGLSKFLRKTPGARAILHGP